ncbi:MAG: RNA-guided endonuclease TnpB family protein [Prochloraceae cyanobacterium]|nr:RNA-guided endonuclease TnpB family protein [Prochloraceae cyanobacterium]
MKARFKYRIYPKPHQIVPLAKAFGCARVVWNDALAIYKKASSEGNPRPQGVDKQVITKAKKTEERAWLSEVSVVHLQQSFRDLQLAWNNFFKSKKGERKGKQVGSPKFKKKQSRQAIRFTQRGFTLHSNSVKIAKIGHIPMVVSRPLPCYPTSVTIIKDTAGRYFASFVVEINPEPMAKTDKSVGIDLGLNHFAILSDGEKIGNPRLHKNMLRRIKKANRRLSKAKKDSNRRKRRKLRLAKLHAKVKDSRNDFLHKLTTRLVRENQALAVENLNVSGMVKNRKLSRAISDAGWYSFRSILDAKCEKYGRDFVVIDRWEATSQKCSACGKHGGKKELNVRAWTCLHCGEQHDRDINAAKNIKAAGGLSEAQNGRGSEY